MADEEKNKVEEPKPDEVKEKETKKETSPDKVIDMNKYPIPEMYVR